MTVLENRTMGAQSQGNYLFMLFSALLWGNKTEKSWETEMVGKFVHVPYWYLSRRFGILFYSILISLALGPILSTMGVPKNFFVVLIGINLAIALYSSRNRILIYCLFPLILVTVSELVNLWFDDRTVSLAGSPVVIALAFAAALSTFLHALHCRDVDAECIYAALSAYLLVGICLGVTYWFINQVLPGSFMVGGAPGDTSLPMTHFLYFSFITITTTGYGDVLPVSDITRGLAVAEAVVGQLYLASMLARLISIYSQRQHNS